MLVTELTSTAYRVELTELELQAFVIIADGQPTLKSLTVSNTIAYILKHCTDRYFLAVKKPNPGNPINPL